MIGLYGMPGVGKTTLAKEVGKHAKEQKLFDNVVMVTMSQTPNISNIQARIAELLGLKFETSTEEGKAEELWRGLKSVKKILIIIDDVWKNFELQTIGIPLGVQHEGCKILLTTRLQQVCVGMDCQKNFELHVLSEVEAWALFKDNAGLTNATSTLNDVAKEVASECKGLPLAIVTLGKALKGEDLNGWRIANQRLKESRHLDNEDVYEDVYYGLKLSYDYLKGDNLQSCFLLCSLFPEDSYISIERLIMFAIGHGLFSNVYSIEVLRMEIGRAIRKLQESSLLLRTDDDDDDDDDDEIYVRMHDVVRDFAHWITLREDNIFMVKEGMTEWPPISENFGCYTSISLWKSNLNNFPDKLEFSKLKIFVFEGKNLMRISGVFIEGMKALQILSLKNVYFSLKVLNVIRNLRTLSFENCMLENISSLKNLEDLEILALLKTNIYELPEDLVVLRRLKSLHFSYFGYYQQSNFPLNLLSRLTSLQELHVTCPNNINLSELNSLSRLTALSLRVSTAQCSQANFVFPKLQRYSIAVNESLRYMEGQKFRTLKIKDFSSSLSAFKELFCNVEKLGLKDVVMVHTNIVPGVDQKGLNELTSLKLRLCNDLEYLMDTTRENGATAMFSNLEKLDLKKMCCLKELCHGPSPISFLQKLKDVIIVDCEGLTVLFQMDGIFELEEYQVSPLSNLTVLKLEDLPELKWIWKEPSHYFSLRNLKVVEIIRCHGLKYLFSPSLAQSLMLLEQLKIRRCNGLEHILRKSENDDNIESNSGHLHHPLLPKLTFLEISRCQRLEFVFQVPLGQGLPHLKSLEITDSPQLKQVFNVAKETNGIGRAIALPFLQNIHLENLINLSCFCSENYPFLLPSLKDLFVQDCPRLEFFNIQQEVNKEIQLKKLFLDVIGNECYTTSWEKILQIQTKKITLRYIYQLQGPIQVASLQYLRAFKVSHCNRLKSIFSFTVARNLPELVNLHIEYCEELEEIIDMNQTSIASSSSSSDHLQPISFPSLEYIRIFECNNLKSLFPISVTSSLSKLRYVDINGASKLEQVFGFQGEVNIEDDEKGIAFPSLKELNLSELPNLNSFAPTGYHFQFPSLYSFEVTECHKLTTSFGIDSKHPVQCHNKGTPSSSE